MFGDTFPCIDGGLITSFTRGSEFLVANKQCIFNLVGAPLLDQLFWCHVPEITHLALVYGIPNRSCAKLSLATVSPPFLTAWAFHD